MWLNFQLLLEVSLKNKLFLSKQLASNFHLSSPISWHPFPSSLLIYSPKWVTSKVWPIRSPMWEGNCLLFYHLQRTNMDRGVYVSVGLMRFQPTSQATLLHDDWFHPELTLITLILLNLITWINLDHNYYIKVIKMRMSVQQKKVLERGGAIYSYHVPQNKTMLARLCSVSPRVNIFGGSADVNKASQQKQYGLI